MTKDQKRIQTLEKEIKELREQVLQLAMRPSYPYVYIHPQPHVNPFTVPYIYPNVTCGGTITASSDSRNLFATDLQVNQNVS